jgi:ATP-dependent exoDNAse (exonuclease V) beta subunit
VKLSVLFVIKQIYDALQPWKQYSEKYREQRQYLINQEFLLEKIIEYARIDSLTLNVVEAFLRINILTKQERQSRQLPNDDKGITILCTTVHKSKGLEYGTVILPYTNWELQASNRLKTDASYSEGKLSYVVVFEDNAFEYNTNFSMDDETIEHMREESRILYVALTRAIRNCVWMKDLDKKLKLSWGTLLEARNAD